MRSSHHRQAAVIFYVFRTGAFHFHGSYLLIQSGAEMFVDRARDLFLGHDADQAFHFFPILEKNQGWNPANAVALCDGWTVIDVQFGEARAVRTLFSNRLDPRGKSAAWRAPCSPEIHQHRRFRLQHELVKISVADFNHMLTHGRPPGKFSRYLPWSSPLPPPIRLRLRASWPGALVPRHR